MPRIRKERARNINDDGSGEGVAGAGGSGGGQKGKELTDSLKERRRERPFNRTNSHWKGGMARNTGDTVKQS